MPFSLMLACLFCVLFIGTNLVNKYVLSELHFTYPTIFQGWQTLVGVVMLRALISTGHVENLLSGRQWQDCALWLPGMMSFLVSIYSGSKALASLPVPVFLAMQNIVLVFRGMADLIFHKQITSAYSYCMLMLSLASALAVAKTDPQFNPGGYSWMLVHILTLGIFEIYTNLMRGRLKLRQTERLFCCYLYSVIVLAPCSYFLGDALAASSFPYLYFGKFYIGCILSGMLGMLMNLSAIYLYERNASDPDAGSPLLDMATVQGAAKMLCACASLAFYPMRFSNAFAIWLAVNNFSSFGFCESSSHLRCHRSSSARKAEAGQSSANSLVRVDGATVLKRQELQQDLIRVEVS